MSYEEYLFYYIGLIFTTLLVGTGIYLTFAWAYERTVNRIVSQFKASRNIIEYVKKRERIKEWLKDNKDISKNT